VQTERDFATQFTQPELVVMRPLEKPIPPEEQVLLAISHSRLRELVRTAYDLARKQVDLPWVRTEYDYLERVKQRGVDAYAYRKWVWRRLHESDLAQQLPGGKSTLPDILDAMHEPWKSLEKLHESKNYEQLLKHLTRYLDWYLNPVKHVRLPVRQIATWVGVALLPIALVLLPRLLPTLHLMGVELPQGIWFWLFAGFWGLILAAINSIMYRFASHKIDGRKVHGFHDAKHQIDAAELYYYLAFAYADRPDPDLPAEL
jgi:hypothetical protein